MIDSKDGYRNFIHIKDVFAGDTFVVIEKRLKKNIIHRFSAKRSLFLFSPRNPLRRLAVCIATNVCFDYFLMFTICVNCVFLAIPNISEFVEYIFLGIYTMEMAIKLVARGFFIDKYTYLRDPWNCLDFTVIMISYITLILQTINHKVVSDITGLRTFRVLRALRTLSIIPGLKTMVNALLRALRMLISVLILILFCLWIFSQAGVQLFGGTLRHKCVLQIYGSPAFGKTYDEFYAEHILNSDNWFAKSNGDYVLCGNATGAGYFVNYFAIYTEFFNEVIRAHSPWTVIYFIVINFFGSLYLMNLMLAVVASAYELEVKNTGKWSRRLLPQTANVNPGATAREQILKEQERRNTLTVSEGDTNQCNHSHLEDSHLHDRNCSCCKKCCRCCFTPWMRIQSYAHYIISDSFTDVFIIFTIVLNTLFLAMEHHGMSMGLKHVLKFANYVFTSVFLLEALLKIVAFNKQYFKSGWNVFDLIVVAASLIDLGVEGLKGVSVFRSFRLLRVFRLAQSWTTMRLLLCIILNTLGSLGYLTIILIIIIYIFAVTGLQLFHTEYTPDKFKGEPVPRWNFNDFLHSFMMVFRILCGEWIEPMYDCMRACNGLCFLIFIPVTVFGKTLFFLFIGLVLGAFGSDSVEQEVEPSSFALAWERIRALLDKRKGNICPTDDNLRDDGQDEAADLDVLQRNVNHASSIREGQYGDVSLSTTKGKNGKQANSKCLKQSKIAKLYYSLPDVVAITKKHQSDIGTSPSMPNIRNLGKDRSSSLRRKSSQASTQSHEKKLTGSSKSLATFSIKRQAGGALQLENVSNKISEQCKGEKSFYSVPNVEKLASEVQQVGGKVTTSLVDIRNSKFSLLTDFPRFDSNLNTDKTDQTQSSKCVTFSKFSTEQDIKSSWASLSSGTKVLPKATSVELKHGVLPNSQVYVQCSKDKKSVPEKCEKLSNSLLDQITDYWKPPSIFKQLFNPPIFIESSTDPIPLQENCRIPNLPEIVESLKKPQRKKSKKLGNSYAIVDQALKDMKYRNLLNTYTDEDLAVLPSLSNQSVQGERTLLSSVDDVNLSNMENIYEEATITNTYGTPVDLLATQQEKFTFQQPFGKPSQLIVVECPKNDSVSNVDSGLIVDPSRFNQEKSKSTDFHIKFDRAEKTPSAFRSLPTSLNNNYNVHVDNSPDPDQQRRISLQHCNIRDVSGTNVDTDSKVLQQQQLLQQHLQRYLEPSSSGSIVEVASDEDLKSNDKSPNFPYIDVEATVRQSYENQNQPHQQPRFSTRSTYYESYEEVKYLTSRKLSCLPPVSEVESDEISTVSEISNSSTTQTTSAIDMVKPTLKIFTSAEPLPTTKTSREALTKNMSRKKIHQSTKSMSTFLAETAPNKCPPAYYVRSTGNLQNKATFADVVLASTKMLRHQKPGLSSSCIDMGMVVSNRIYDQQREFGAPKTAISLSDMKYIGSRTSQSSPSNRSNSMADVGSMCNKLSKSEGRRYSYSMSDVKNLKNSMSGSNKGSTKSLSRIGSAIMKVQQNSEETKIDLRNNLKKSKLDDVIMENNCNNESLGSLGSLGSIPDIMDNSSVEEDVSSCQQKDIQPCLPLFITSRFKCLREFDDTTHGKKWNNFRRRLMMVCENKYFETGVLIMIFASSILLAFEDIYLHEKPYLKLALFYLDITFCLLFFLEMVLKLLALGFVHYYTHFWTILDFTIVCITIISLAASGLGMEQITAFRSLRTLRALRPLRAVSRWQGMKIIVNALMLSIPSIFNVLLVCVVFWLIFAIMGVQLFAGKFYKCVNETNMRISPTEVASKQECLYKNYTWVNSKVNFDNVGGAFLALFQVATFEGWMEIMADAVDVTEVDQQPKFEASVYYYFYFVMFIIFGSFFVLNLVIGVIIDKFSFLKKKYDGTYLDMFLTPTQQNYYNTLKKLGTKKPQKTVRKPKNKCQAVVYDLVMSNQFEIFITTIIITNMIFMAFEHYNQSDVVTEVLATANIAFTILYAFEAIIKIVALRIHYLRNLWNVFDFLVVSLSVVDAFLNDVFGAGMFMNPSLLRVARMFRIGRIIRLIKWAKGMRKLLFALVISLPALFNIGALLFLVMFIYTIIGMSSFGQIKLSGALNDQVNFQTFGKTFLLLVRLATSAGWNDILGPLLIQPPNCDPNYTTTSTGEKIKLVNGDCGMPWLAISYMVSYIIIVFMIVFNMYIAVILENFNQAHAQEEVGITEDDLDMFYGVWEQYDPLATQFIKHDQLSDFIQDLDPPLKVKKPNNVAIATFDLPIVKGGHIHCLDILLALVKFALGGNLEETEAFKRVRTQMEAKFDKIFPTREKSEIRTSTLQMRREEMAARILQRAWRRRKIMQSFPSPEMIRYYIISAPETAV
ncbi:sodium channel protein 1 brain [Octopus bimaculoides]|uniref:sodium channel protein 1 brain n=1 Tax=Octopus bimaculoides TaxID=37653 RepID=UPI00071D08D1|nr:sodium channel protein 1 brain [Octopus bimaculoides]|eukprot:XP_014771226.1 PREDICTED: sodium channel protein 1 brain [Octopus bimaculoides]